MTTIAYRNGVLAADSRETSGCEDSGQLAATCQKLFQVGPFWVALQGDTTPGMAWLHWFRKEYGDAPANAEAAVKLVGRQWATETEERTFKQAFAKLKLTPADIIDRFLENEADFTAVILTPNGTAWIYDEWGIPQLITAEYYAVGSGAKVAYGAMFNGAGAAAAVEAACAHDPYTSGPVVTSENI